MKWLLLALMGFAAVLVIQAEELPELPEEFNLSDIEDLDEDDEEILRELEQKALNKDMERENDLAMKLLMEAGEQDNTILTPIVEIDPCEKMHCGAGRICQVEEYKAKCVCIPDCRVETDPRRHVCTNKNETWNSDCAVYQQRCFCDNNEPGCLTPENVHLHIDYYGDCHVQKKCEVEEMSDFPRRMRDWLFTVMRDLAERDELTEHYMQMELEAETNMTRRWSNAAIWKWCDLDGDTDRSVSRHELFPIRAPLVSLEHCIAPFLESCDSNNDHRISLVEWGACLQLEEDDLNERCDTIHKTVPRLVG